MINLAGKDDSNDFVKDELQRAGIKLIDTETYGECRTNYKGELIANNRKYTFTRAWYYWIVDGLVPIDIAKKLFEHPEGRKNIRVDGWAGNEEPEKHSIYIDKNGKKMISTKEVKNFEHFPKLWEDNKHKYKVSDNKDGFDQYIDIYHIDSQAGLLYFVETLKRGEKVPEIDLDQESWSMIKQAASESSWIPEEYYMNDWVFDVSQYLREGGDLSGTELTKDNIKQGMSISQNNGRSYYGVIQYLFKDKRSFVFKSIDNGEESTERIESGWSIEGE